MTPSESTSGRLRRLVEPLDRAVVGDLVGLAVVPAAVDHAGPTAGEDADGVGVVFPVGASSLVEPS